MGMMGEFKKFALRGNVVDMAVGVIIGGAFGKIVSSMVDDVVMPPLGLAVGGMDFSEYKLTLREAAEGVEAVTLNWGNFVNQTVNFLIVAFALFMLIKGINRMTELAKKKEEAGPPPAPPEEVVLLREIRDSLKK
jgi:large conductance mechanosensitive channel